MCSRTVVTVYIYIYIYIPVLTSLLLPHSSSSLTDSLLSLNILCHPKTDARFRQDGRKAA